MRKTYLKCLSVVQNEWYSGLLTAGKEYEVLNKPGARFSLIKNDEGTEMLISVADSVYGTFELVYEYVPIILEYSGTNKPYTALDVINNKRNK